LSLVEGIDTKIFELFLEVFHHTRDLLKVTLVSNRYITKDKGQVTSDE